MGFFVMITQRTKDRPAASLCARAHASVRPVSLLHVLLADSLLRLTRLQPIVASTTARYFHDQPSCCTCFGESPPYNSHKQTLLLPQRFSPTGFILNASHCNCCHQSLSARIQVKT